MMREDKMTKQEKEIIQLNDLIFDRDEKGEFIGQSVPLIEPIKDKNGNEINGNIVVIPLTRGERKKYFGKGKEINEGNTDFDLEAEIVKTHCVNPKFDDDTVQLTPFGTLETIAWTILRASGMDIKTKQDDAEKANKRVETDFQNASNQ